MQCNSNLRQIALAVVQYESTYRVFPAGHSRGSFLVKALPFLEQQEVSDTLSGDYESQQFPGTFEPVDIVLPVLYCPSDPAALVMSRRAGTNFAGNCGVWRVSEGEFNGLFRYRPGVRAAEVTDGLSNTAMACELLRADGSTDRLRTVWNTPRRYNYPNQIGAFVRRCGSIPVNPERYGWRGNAYLRGTPWVDGNITRTLYNHGMPPNSPSCFSGATVPNAFASAASLHRSVNLALADGSTKGISPSIDLAVWRGFGSRVENRN